MKIGKALALFVGLALVLSLATVLLAPKDQGSTACIYQDGVLMQQIDLERVKKPYSIEIPGVGGGSNTVLVEPGRIRVSAADCPDQVCVEQGYISNGAMPIVCLPHKLLVEITGGGEEIDAATG